MAIGETTDSPNDQHNNLTHTTTSEKANLETHTKTHTSEQRSPDPPCCTVSRAAAAHPPSSQLGRAAGPALTNRSNTPTSPLE